MKKGLLRKVLLSTLGVFFLLVAILAMHIYVVTKPRVDEKTRVLARIDIKHPIDKDDADKITTWLYQQNGVDHVLCNPKTEIVVFSFSPLKANGNEIAESFKSKFNYADAKRYVPTSEELRGSCPVASTSFTYKAYKFIKHIL